MLVRFLVAATVGRLGVFVVPVGLFFAASEAGSSEGVQFLRLASGVTVGRGLALWPAGRVLDRVGSWRGLRASTALAAVGLVVLAGTAHWGLPDVAVLTGGVIVGGVTAPLVALPRAVLPGVVSERWRARASAWEAASVEVSLLAAPPVGFWLAARDVEAVLVGAGALIAMAWAGLPRRTGRVAMPSRTRGAGTPLTGRIAGVAVLAAGVGLSGGLLEPGLAGLPAPISGWQGSTPLLFVSLGAGSLAGGVIAGRVGWPTRGVHCLPLLAVHATGLAVAGTVEGSARLLALLVAGVPFAPLVSAVGLVVDRETPRGRTSEAFAVVAAALEVGTALGQASAAEVVSTLGPRTLVMLAAVPPVLVLVTVAAGSAAGRPAKRAGGDQRQCGGQGEQRQRGRRGGGQGGS